jgi:hypothetical protein
MKIPAWYKAKNGKWVALTHFPDGEIGLTMQQAIDQGLVKGLGQGMGHLDVKKIYFVHFGWTGRFLLREEP